MTIIKPDKQLKEYNKKTLNHMHKLHLMMIKDFMKICDENNIQYAFAYGTLIGAVRHKGFIPWDDDIDLLMTCENYDKFKEVMSKDNDKYELLSLHTTRDYLYMYSEVNLKHTFRIEHYHDNDNFTHGLTVDIFLLVNSTENKIKRSVWNFEYKLYRKILYIHEYTHNDVYVSKNKQRIGRLIHKVLKTIKIDHKRIKKFALYLLNKHNNNENSSTFAIFGGENIRYMKKNIICPMNKKLPFESIEINVPNDYDSFLRNVYGDYMELPPLNQRRNHDWDIDFGPYKNYK